MRFEFINERGDVLSLMGSRDFRLTNIEGQTSINTNISSSIIGSADGDTVNNVQAQPRTLIFDLRILQNVELTKRNILDTIKLKQNGKIRWEQENKVLEINGVVEEIDMPRWNNNVTMQVTLHCEQPFWEDLDAIVSDINELIDLHYFTTYPNDQLIFTEEGQPFGEYDVTRTRLINNAGDVSVGLQIEIVANGTVTNPIIYGENEKFFGCGHGNGDKRVVMHAGDVIRINTTKDNKYATLNEESLLGKIKPNSTWLQLAAGDNVFSIDSDEHETENMSFSLAYKRRYV